MRQAAEFILRYDQILIGIYSELLCYRITLLYVSLLLHLNFTYEEAVLVFQERLARQLSRLQQWQRRAQG